MQRGELAIRAKHRTRRAAARKSESSDEAKSIRIEAMIAAKDAETMLQPPENLVSSCGEAIQSDFRLAHIVDTLKTPNMISIVASEHRLDIAACVGSRVAEAAIDAAQSAQASNSLEKMLCHQMAAANYAAMKLVADSLNKSLPPIEQARLSNASARMMKTYQDAALTLQKLRTGGKQTVVVQHVQVSEGGQAVIAGSVKGGPNGE